MGVTTSGTEKISKLITHVYIGYSGTYLDINEGIEEFEFWPEHPITPSHAGNTKTSSEAHQPHSSYGWRLTFCSDCRAAFFETDVQVVEGDQFALVPGADSNKIEYFKIVVPIKDASGVTKTRTYTITSGYCLGVGRTRIGGGETPKVPYEGIAEKIEWADA